MSSKAIPTPPYSKESCKNTTITPIECSFINDCEESGFREQNPGALEQSRTTRYYPRSVRLAFVAMACSASLALLYQGHSASFSKGHEINRFLPIFQEKQREYQQLGLQVENVDLAEQRRRHLEQEGNSKDNSGEEENSRDHRYNRDDDAPVYIFDDYVDDFYAFQEDPGPPHLLPLRSRDVAGFFLASLGITLGASGGIGSGGIIVPIYILMIGFEPHIAIPLSSVTVFGGAVASLSKNLSRRHPLADRPIIDWDLVLMMEPLTLIGALLGTMLHRVLSEKILLVLLVLLLSVAAHSTLTKAKRMYDAECRYIQRLQDAKAADARLSPTSEQKFVSNGVVPASNQPISSVDKSLRERLDVEERQQILILNPDFVTLRSDLLEEERVTPRSKIIAVCCMFSVVIFLNTMVGGGAFQSPWGIRCGSVPYWVVHVIMVAFLFSSAWAAQTYLVNRHHIKRVVDFDYVHGDIIWDSRSSIIYPILFMIAGLFAGLFGIGGGMINVPLMLTMGVHPAVACATSSAMIFFTSFASSSSFAVFGLILWDYAILCVCLGFFASLFGQTIMQQARQAGSVNGRNFERNSLIGFCIGGVILISALLMTIQYVFTIVHIDEVGSNDGGLCDGYRIAV